MAVIVTGLVRRQRWMEKFTYLGRALPKSLRLILVAGHWQTARAVTSINRLMLVWDLAAPRSVHLHGTWQRVGSSIQWF
jgi:hypothetical protein